MIRYILIANARDLDLLGRETSFGLLRGTCQAKDGEKRRVKIAWANFCLTGRVRDELLSRCSRDRFQQLYRSIHHVVDYFFERFIPSRCEEIPRLGGKALERLLNEFVKGEEMKKGWCKGRLADCSSVDIHGKAV